MGLPFPRRVQNKYLWFNLPCDIWKFKWVKSFDRNKVKKVFQKKIE